MDDLGIKRRFRILERNVLLLIIAPLPFFSFAYLYTTNAIREIEVPELPQFLNLFALSLAIALLGFQQINFQRNISYIRENGADLEDRFKRYSKAITNRYWILCLVGFISAAGLWLYENPGFTVAYAITLVLISVAKPSPERIIRLLHLKGEERDRMFNINKIEG